MADFEEKTQLADDGPHRVDSSLSNMPIDVRSRIVLAFDIAQLGRSENEGRWQSLKAVLEEVKELAVQRATAIVSLTAAQGGGDVKVKGAQKLAQVYNSKYLDFRTRVRKIIGENTFKQIDQAVSTRVNSPKNDDPVCITPA